LNPKFQNRNKFTPLWFTFSVYIDGIWAKPYGIKLRCYWEYLGDTFGNLMRIPWEHIRMKKKTHRPASPPRTPTQEKDRTPHWSMLILLIGCMKFLFPKLFVTIFDLGEWQGHELWDYGLVPIFLIKEMYQIHYANLGANFVDSQNSST
jgi:hypothetical protein